MSCCGGGPPSSCSGPPGSCGGGPPGSCGGGCEFCNLLLDPCYKKLCHNTKRQIYGQIRGRCCAPKCTPPCSILCPQPDPRCCPKPLTLSFKCPTKTYAMPQPTCHNPKPSCFPSCEIPCQQTSNGNCFMYIKPCAPPCCPRFSC